MQDAPELVRVCQLKQFPNALIPSTWQVTLLPTAIPFNIWGDDEAVHTNTYWTCKSHSVAVITLPVCNQKQVQLVKHPSFNNLTRVSQR